MGNFLKRKKESMKIIRGIPQIGKGNSRTLPHYILRKDAGESFEKCLRDIQDKSGILLPSAGGFRPMSSSLKSSKKTGRSQVSLHCLGLAIDIATWIGGVNPEKDMILIEWNGDRKSVPILYLKTPQGESKTIECYYVKNKKLSAMRVTSNVINITSILNSYGWYGIPYRPGFLKDDPGVKIKSYYCWEWWHFQFNQGLKDGISTYGSALEEIYDYEDIEGFKFNHYIFHGRSFRK